MELHWRKIKNTRHVLADGKAICGRQGGYTEDTDATPCQKCLLLLFALQSEAFTDELAEVV